MVRLLLMPSPSQPAWQRFELRPWGCGVNLAQSCPAAGGAPRSGCEADVQLFLFFYFIKQFTEFVDFLQVSIGSALSADLGCVAWPTCILAFPVPGEAAHGLESHR